MRKFFSVAFATIGSLILIFAMVFTSMELVINDETFINNEFTKLGTSSSMGMSNVDLVRSTVRLIDYMQGTVDDIHLEVEVNGETVEMFALEQEVTHMEDVRLIYLQIKEYRDVGALAMLLLFLLAAVINFRKAPQMLSQGYLSGSFIALLFFGFLGTWAAMDFTSFWNFFHQMLFWNDLWLFDAGESRMINMLPEQMFADIVGQIFLYAGIAFGALAGLSVICLIFSSDAYKRKKAESLKKKKARQVAAEARKKAKAQAKAEAEKAKRIAAKKAKKAKLKKQQAKRKAAAKKGKTQGDSTEEPTTTTTDPDDEPSVSYGPEVTAELSEGYAADFFQSATYADYQSGALSTTTTTTTTSGGLYPEAPNADFFKSYGAAQQSAAPNASATLSEGALPYDREVYGEATYGEIDYASATYGEVAFMEPDDGPAASSAAGRNTDRSRSANGGKKTASKKGAKKAPGKKKAKSQSNVVDDTGFFDD